MAIVNITRCTKRNIPTALSVAGGSESIAGKSQDFIFKFESADDKSLILINNAGPNAITVKLSGNGTKDTPTYTVNSCKVAIIPIESGICENQNGEIKLTVAPENATKKLMDCELTISGISTGIVTR